MITTGAITRAVVGEMRDDRDDDGPNLDRIGEITQQLSVDVTGTATSVIAWTTLTVAFDCEFYDSDNRRYSNLEEPCFSSGYKTEFDVVIVARLVSFEFRLEPDPANPGEFRERGDVIAGATVAIGAFVPSGSAVAYTGRVDLSWQGWGCLASEPSGEIDGAYAD